MLSAALAAAPKIAPEAFPKPQYFTAPSGRRYKWGKATPPTQADLDAIVAYEQQVDADSKAKGNRGKVPLMASEPGNPEKVNIVKGKGTLKDELIRKTTQGLARAGYNPALTPAEDPRSGFQKALVGESETSRLLSENAQRLVNNPVLTGIGNAYGEALGITQALKLVGANKQADQVQSLVGGLANPANLSGIAPLMQAAANPTEAADTNFYNAFDASKPPEERAQSMFNIALFIAAHGAGTKIGGVTVTDKIKDAAMAFKEARTPIARKALEDALYTARQTAAPVQGVPDPLKPAPALNVPRTQVGPPEAKLGTIQGASVAGRRMTTRAIPVENTPGVKVDKSTQTILNRAEAIRTKNEFDAAMARRAESQKPPMKALGMGAQPLPQPTTPFPGQKYGLVPVEPPLAPNTTRPVIAREPGVESQYGQKPSTQKAQTKALPARTPEPASVAVQPKSGNKGVAGPRVESAPASAPKATIKPATGVTEPKGEWKMVRGKYQFVPEGQSTALPDLNKSVKDLQSRLESSGFKVSRKDGSSQSKSQYIYAVGPDGIEHKFRVSNHIQPSDTGAIRVEYPEIDTHNGNPIRVKVVDKGLPGEGKLVDFPDGVTQKALDDALSRMGVAKPIKPTPNPTVTPKTGLGTAYDEPKPVAKVAEPKVETPVVAPKTPEQAASPIINDEWDAKARKAFKSAPVSIRNLIDKEPRRGYADEHKLNQWLHENGIRTADGDNILIRHNNLRDLDERMKGDLVDFGTNPKPKPVIDNLSTVTGKKEVLQSDNWWSDTHQMHKAPMPKGYEASARQVDFNRVIQAAESSGKYPAKEIAENHHLPNMPRVVLESAEGHRTLVNQRYLETARMVHGKDVEFYIGDHPNKPVRFVKDGKTVGVVMPMGAPDSMNLKGFKPTPKTGLDAAYEAAVKSRKQSGTGNKNRQRGATENPAQVLADYAVIAAWHIRNGARTGREVLTNLLSEHPYDADLIKANFNQIIGDARQSLPEKPYRMKPSGKIVGPERLKSNEAKVSTGIETATGTTAEMSKSNLGVKPTFPNENPGAIPTKIRPAGPSVTLESVGVKSANVNKPTPKEPQLTVRPPLVIKPGESPTRFAASNAASNDVRAAIGVDKLPDADKRKWTEVLTSATKTYDGDAIDARIKDASKPLSDVETAQAAMRSAELSRKLKAATGETYDDLETKLLDHTIALRNAGTEQGRALAARNMAVLEDYSLDGMYRRYVGASKAKSAADISPDVRAQIKGISESYDQINTRVAELQKRFDEQAVKLAETERAKIAAEIKTRGARKAATKVTRDDLVARIRKNQSQYISSVPIQGLIDSADDIKALVKLTIQDGITDLSEVYKAVSADLKKGGVDLTRSEFDGVLAGAYKKTPGLKRDLTEYQRLLKEARESGAGKDAMVWQRVRRLDERIKAQQYDNLKTTPIGKALTDAEIALKAKQVEFDRLKTQAKVKAEYDAMSPAGRGYNNAKQLGNAIRSVVASTDVNAPLNQGFFYTLSHPGKSASAMWETMGAIKGDEALNRIMGKIRNNQYYELGRGSKLQVGAAAGDYADDFMTFGDSNLAKAITGKYSPIGASERVYKAYVTKIRMDMFADLAKAEERASGGRLKRSDYEAIAEFVNTVTGTTTNKYVEDVSEPLGALMFAPKYTVARIKTVFATPAINAARVGNYRLAGRILGEYAKVAVAIGGAVYVANKNGANIELDPRSPEFMKGRIGNVEFNADQGLGQTWRLLAAILNPALDRIPGLPDVKGKKSSSYGAIENYFTNRFAPVPRIAKNAIDGKAFGKSYDVSKQEGWINLGLSLLPISVQSGKELYDRKDISDEQKAAIGLAGFLGVKIDSDPPRK